jgi:N-acylneuraminate cytidylyltransferase
MSKNKNPPCIAIIPARSGSRRIKNKNIKFFFGHPMISYAIKNAIKSNLFDKIIVSTNDNRIKKISNRFGASTPFVRPKKLATNKTSILKVMCHAVKKEAIKDNSFFAVCCIFPTSPLIKPKDLKKSFKLFKTRKRDYIFAAKKCNNYQKVRFKINSNFNIKKVFLKKSKINKSDPQSFYDDAGQFYWAKPSTWLKRKKIFSNKSTVYVFSNTKIVDINTKNDWEKAKRIFKKK